MTIAIGLLPMSSFQRPSISGIEETKYQNFLSAFQNRSTFSYFTVITVKDLRSKITKEICVKGNFVNGAVHRELRADYDSVGDRKVSEWTLPKKNRCFEFRNRKALENISFSSYDTQLVRAIQTKFNFDSIIAKIDTEKRFSIRLADREMKAFAHILFNKGYLTGESNCWGGELVYVDKTNPYFLNR